MLLCSRKDCFALEKIVAFSKRLLRSRKDCCVSEEKLSCVLPLWATVVSSDHTDFVREFEPDGQKELTLYLIYIVQINTTGSVEDHGTFPRGRSRCNTCAHTNALPTINTPGGHKSPSIPSTPVQATTWYILPNAVPATRYTSERQEDAWEIDSGNTYVQYDKPTPMFPLVDILHHQGTPRLICWCP